MTRRHLPRELMLCLIVAASGCGSPAPPASPVLFALLSTFREPTNGCPAALLANVTLRGDPTDRVNPVWVENERAEKLRIMWPYGFTARFTPRLEVVSGSGLVVAREGDVLDLGGGQVDQVHDFFACSIEVRPNPD